jgi:hypothetical protein
MSTAVSKPPLTDYNRWARFWYYDKHLNVIPAKTRIKKTFIQWKEGEQNYQITRIPQEQFEKWIKEDEFRDGMAIILGKVWGGEYEGLYFTLIDLDNLRAIDEFCGAMNNVSLKDLAQKFIVEQHRDNTSKAHILFYSAVPFMGKSSDAAKFADEICNNEIPGFEIKGQGTHGIVYCTPSVHQDGEHYEIIGTTSPAVLSKEAANDMMQTIDNICKKYGLHYLDNVTADPNGTNKALIPMSELYSDNFVIYEGHNRHEALLRIMESTLLTFRKKMSENAIKEYCRFWNQIHCSPPLDEGEFERQWKDAQKFVARKDAEREAAENQEEFLDGCLMMELVNRSPETYIAVIRKDDYHNPTTGMKQKLRAVQEVVIERIENKKNGQISEETKYKHFIINAIPIPPIEVICDPLFELTKYKMRFEYVGPSNTVIEMNEPAGPFTKEELKDWLLDQNWVYKQKLLDDTLAQLIKGYRSRKGMSKEYTEIETQGLIWLPRENRLTLSKLTRYKPTPEECRECIKVMSELQNKFYSPTDKRPFERKRFAHFVKVGVVAPLDFARRQCGAVESHGFIPRQDLGGWSNAGKTLGYAGLALRLYRLPLYGKTPYVIGSGSVETEARLIRHTKGMTLPVILDDADFFTEWQKNDQAKRCLSIMKYATENTNPRDILTQDSKVLNLPLCAYTMFTHNSDLIDEDGFIRRSTGHEFTKDDQKTENEIEEYQKYFDDPHHSHIFGCLGDFALDYYLENPRIMWNDWLTIAKTVLKAFFTYAEVPEEEIPQWLLNEVVESSTSQAKLAENRSTAIATTFHDIIQNQGWVRNKREAAIWICKNSRKSIKGSSINGLIDYETDDARHAIDHVMATATIEEKIRALTALNALPAFRWHDTYEVCITAPIIEELRKHGITRISHTQLPSYCEGFTYDKIWFGKQQQRVVYARLAAFIDFINPARRQQ